MTRIYLDHNATTRPHPTVVAAMAPYHGERFGNPSSPHAEGRMARDAVERARAEVAALVGAEPGELVFTSGGTEGDNLAIQGGARARRALDGARRRVVSSPLEHPAVRGSLERLAAEGFEVALVEPGPDGTIEPAAVAPLVDERTALVTLAAANHELGNVYPLAALAALAHAHGAWFHTDAVQAAGKVALDVRADGVDLLTLSGHKLYGPKGSGAVFLRRGLDVPSLFAGGHQERERRPGTENVAAVVGLGAACALARRELAGWARAIAARRDRLEAGAMALGAHRFGAAARVPNTCNLGFPGVPGELLMQSLDLEGVAVSTGAACSSGTIEPSRVILALGCDRAIAAEATRFSLGWDNRDDEIDAVLALLPGIVERIRANASPS